MNKFTNISNSTIISDSFKTTVINKENNEPLNKEAEDIQPTNAQRPNIINYSKGRKINLETVVKIIVAIGAIATLIYKSIEWFVLKK